MRSIESTSIPTLISLIEPHSLDFPTMSISDVDVAIMAASAGADVVRARYGTRLEKTPKSPLDFATDADIESERAIFRVIRSARPNDELIGEESGHVNEGRSGRVWLIDPLCGTVNFAARTPLVGINVALQTTDGITAAATADPLSGEIMWTDGVRACLRGDDSDTTLRPSADSRLVDVNLDGPYPNGEWFDSVRVLADPDFASSFRPRVSSTSLALAWVAAGRRAAYITDGDLLGSVHFASALALCQSVGCVVTNLLGDEPHTGVRGLVASSDEHTHEVLLSVIRRQLSRSNSATPGLSTGDS